MLAKNGAACYSPVLLDDFGVMPIAQIFGWGRHVIGAEDLGEHAWDVIWRHEIAAFKRDGLARAEVGAREQLAEANRRHKVQGARVVVVLKAAKCAIPLQ